MYVYKKNFIQEMQQKHINRQNNKKFILNLKQTKNKKLNKIRKQTYTHFYWHQIINNFSDI